MTIWIGAAGGNKVLADPKAGTPAGRKDVQTIHIGTAAGNKLVYSRQPVALAAAATRWDQAALTITPPGGGADTYTIRRGSTQVYSGTGLSFTDTLLLPGTAYTWTVDAYRGTDKVGSATASATTPARSDLGLTATAVAYNRIDLAWTDPSGGSIDQYRLKRGSTVIYTGTGKAKSDTGLSASTAYSYTLEALRAGAVILPTDTASRSTPARPTAQKTWEASRTSYASYNGSGGLRTDTSDLYSGYYSGTHGNQKSSANFAIPAEVRGCISVDQVWISAWNLHAYNNSGRNVQLAVNHYGAATDGSGSTGTAVELAAGKPGWVGGAEWVEVGNYVCPGRTSIKEEFRANGAGGFTFNPGPSTSQAYYGYARNDVRIRIVYTVYA